MSLVSSRLASFTRRAGVATSLTLSASAVLSTQCGPPPADNDIEIHRGQNLVWSRGANMDSAWDSADMTPLPGLGLVQAPSPDERFFVTFHSLGVQETAFTVQNDEKTLVSLRTTPELHLFARDPEEVYETLVTLPVDRWDIEIHTPKPGADFSSTPPYHLPVDVVLPYNFRFPIPTRTVNPLRPDAFWRLSASAATPPSDWFGIGSAPDGFGSIKAARLVTLPKCSTSVPLQPLLEQIASPLQDLLKVSGCKRGSTVDVSTDVKALTAVQYFAHQAPPGGAKTPETGLRSGLLVGGRVRAAISSALINSTCLMDFVYDYTYGLADGFVTIVPHEVYLAAEDPTTDACTSLFFIPGPGAIGYLRNALALRLPKALRNQAIELQQFPPIDLADTPPFNGDDWSCQYNTSSDQTDANECGRARVVLAQAAGIGASNLGLTLSSTDADRLQATVLNPRNWRCRPPTNDELAAECGASQPVRGRCQFQVRGESVLAEPDELRVVPFSDASDYERPGVALFLASFTSRPGGIDVGAYKNLCSPARNPEQESVDQKVSPVLRYYVRPFAGAIVPPFNCVLPPKFVPPDTRTLRCPCSTDADCPRRDRCLLELGRPGKYCERTCNQNADCPFDVCYGDIHQCGGAPCNDTTLSCPLYEHCVGGGNNQIGTCARILQ